MARARWVAFGSVVLAATGVTSRARAYRPFDGTDADVADYGEYELELEPCGLYREGSRDSLVAPYAINNYGFLPRNELVLEGRQLVQIDGAGAPHASLVEPQLFVKTVLREGALQGGRGLSVASEVGPYFPEAGTGATKLGGQIGVIVSEAWRDLAVHLNVVDYLSRAGDYGLFTSLIVEGPARWRVRPVGELLADREFGSTTLRDGLTRSVLGGFIWHVTEGFDVDAALRVGAVEDRAMREVRLGFTWAVEVLPPSPAPIKD